MESGLTMVKCFFVKSGKILAREQYYIVFTNQALPINYELVNRCCDRGGPDNPLWIIVGPQAREDPEIIHKQRWVWSPQISTDYSRKYEQTIALDLLAPNLSFQ